MVDLPAGCGIFVDNALVLVAAFRAEVLDREIANRYVRGAAAERVEVVMLPADNSAGRTDVSRSRTGDNLGVLAWPKSMNARGEPIGRAGLAPIDAAVVACWDGDRPRGSG